MYRCTHETSDLKLVMLFDRGNRTYCVCSHNLVTPTMPHKKWPSYVATVFRHSPWTNTRGTRRPMPTNALPARRMSSSRSIRCLLSSAGDGRPDSAARLTS